MLKQKRRKILVVVSCFLTGGMEKGYLNLVRHGFFDGCDVEIISLCKPNDVELYEKLSLELGRNDEGRPRLSYIIDKCVDKPGRWYNVWWALGKKMTAYEPDAVILSLGWAIQAGTAVSFLFPHTRVLAFEHIGTARPREGRMERRLLHLRTDNLLVDSAATLAARGDEYPQKLRNAALEVPLIIIDPKFPITERRIEDGKTVELLSVGKLVPLKNHIAVIRAVKILKDKGYNLRLTIAGEGALRKEFETFACQQGISDAIRLPGTLGDLQELAQRSHILVHPSLFEGLCLTVLEMMGVGLPIIATNVGGMERYGTASNMVKLKGTDEVSVANAIQGLIDRYNTDAMPMVQAASKTAVSQYGRAAVRQRWQEVRTVIETPLPLSQRRPVVPLKGIFCLAKKEPYILP
jgi:glycosyltransferase involved in cell wall biosynthesis